MRICGTAVVVLCLAGCRSIGPEELRARPAQKGVYHCSLSLEDAYRALTEDILRNEMYQEDEMTPAIFHASYPDRHCATIYRQYADFELATMWLLDIEAAPDGCIIRAYAINPGQWTVIDRTVRKLPDIRKEG
jgi:hypothetical protein